MQIEKQVDLQHQNTLAVPSVARYFVRCETVGDIQEACAWAQAQQLPIRVLGEGSNVLLPELLPILIMQVAIFGFEASTKNEGILLWLGAGENWHSVVERCVDKGYHGIENLALIPGKVGAAPIQNIGAYGVELESVFEGLEAIDLQTGLSCYFTEAECDFAYRDSYFKSVEAHRYAITRVCLSLSSVFKPVLSYAPLNALEQDVSVRKVFDAVCRVRQSKLPHPKNIPNAGSFFKNPIVPNKKCMKLQSRFPGLPHYETGNGSHVKIPAAWLIDQLGWKAKSLQGVHVHTQQALVVCNPERQPLAAILAFSEALQQDVRRHFGIVLEREPQLFF